MTVAGNDLSGVKRVPDLFLQLFVIGYTSESFQSAENELEAFLVCQTVQWTGQPVQPCRDGVVEIRQCRIDDVAGEGTDVSTLMIAVDGKVETDHIGEDRIIVSNTQHPREVTSPVEVGIPLDPRTFLVPHPVDPSSNFREPGEQVEGILESRDPVIGFLDAGVVGLLELGFPLHRENGQIEHSHWMRINGRRLEDVPNV